MDIEQLITRTTYRITIDKKRYLCCVIDCGFSVRFSMSREWGFPIRPHTEVWEKIYKALVDKHYKENKEWLNITGIANW